MKIKQHTAYISLGSNMGDKKSYCRKGIAGLEKSGASVITGRSKFYRTEPVDYTDQDWFINAAVRIETRLSPYELLDEINAIELEAGRDRNLVRFGPRTLDMDIILYDDLIIESPRLTLPHPRMHKRLFVLKPICDIDPCMRHPLLKQDVQSLLDNLDDNGQEIILDE